MEKSQGQLSGFCPQQLEEWIYHLMDEKPISTQKGRGSRIQLWMDQL